VTFTGGEHAGWAVQITTGFSIANTIANVLSGWASDFLWTKVSSYSHRTHHTRTHRAYRTRMHRTHRTRTYAPVNSSSSRGTSCWRSLCCSTLWCSPSSWASRTALHIRPPRHRSCFSFL
jgi:hypothetical protein